MLIIWNMCWFLIFTAILLQFLKSLCSHPCSQTLLFVLWSCLSLGVSLLYERIHPLSLYFKALCLCRLMRKHGNTHLQHSRWYTAEPHFFFSQVSQHQTEDLVIQYIWVFWFLAAVWDTVFLDHKKRECTHLSLSVQFCWLNYGHRSNIYVAFWWKLIVTWVWSALRAGAKLKTDDSHDTLLANLAKSKWVVDTHLPYAFI